MIYLVLSDVVDDWPPERYDPITSYAFGPYERIDVEPSGRRRNVARDHETGRVLARQKPNGWSSFYGGPTFKSMRLQSSLPEEFKSK
jgi:hypothetical protein